MFIEAEPLQQPTVDRDFDAFYASTVGRVRALAYALTGDWGDAEDLVQEALTTAHRRWFEVSGYDDPVAWVRRLVANRAVSRWRRVQREAALLMRLGGRVREAAQDEDPIDPAFWSAVRALPQQQARVIALHYLDDLSVEQIAVVLECSESSVKTHLSRGRATLTARLVVEEDR